MLVRETPVCTRQAEAVLATSEPRCSLGTAETGRSLAIPHQFTDAEPLAWKRVEDHPSTKRTLEDTLSHDGPSSHLEGDAGRQR